MLNVLICSEVGLFPREKINSPVELRKSLSERQIDGKTLFAMKKRQVDALFCEIDGQSQVKIGGKARFRQFLSELKENEKRDEEERKFVDSREFVRSSSEKNLVEREVRVDASAEDKSEEKNRTPVYLIDEEIPVRFLQKSFVREKLISLIEEENPSVEFSIEESRPKQTRPKTVFKLTFGVARRETKRIARRVRFFLSKIVRREMKISKSSSTKNPPLFSVIFLVSVNPFKFCSTTIDLVQRIFDDHFFVPTVFTWKDEKTSTIELFLLDDQNFRLVGRDEIEPEKFFDQQIRFARLVRRRADRKVQILEFVDPISGKVSSREEVFVIDKFDKLFEELVDRERNNSASVFVVENWSSKTKIDLFGHSTRVEEVCRRFNRLIDKFRVATFSIDCDQVRIVCLRLV